MTLDELIRKYQKAIGTTVDGKFGPVTTATGEKFDVTITAKVKVLPVPPTQTKPLSGDYFGAPWVGVSLDLLGLDENDPKLNVRFVPEWKLEGLDYKSLSGNSHAWCSVAVNADFRSVKVKGTDSAGASSWSKWGRACPFWFGAVLPIKHKGGGRHVNRFLYWIDEKKKIAATLDGNRSNKFWVVKTDLSGAGDTLIPGPRWSKDLADGVFVSMEEVIAKYPNLKVTGSGGSTR